ncbi:hypothetical protein TrST_g11797 [Triparma strigata]|uniref:Uncharacterized protein n=1 Tax=Triparma strigata TaxID=1606541 RepID=A0A9W7AYL3_9STRA|nr:hypothetical protein TrST_g11797 [Triparma strigata]
MRIVVAIVAIICAACPALAFKAHIISLHARPSNASPSKLLSAPPNPFRAAMPPALPAKDEEDLTSKITTYLNTVDPNSCQTPLNNLKTLLRITVPSVVAAVGAFFAFPYLALSLAAAVNNAGVFAVLSQDSSQFVQNFLTVTGLLFSILVGQTYYFMYQQQEAVYLSLFNEVTEAKSLLEQTTLIAGSRPIYPKILAYINSYINNDLRQLNSPPSRLLARRPDKDPLESIMFVTSVGVPSSLYETVRTLRQARAGRLGSMQRKLPSSHIFLLQILAFIELLSFPLLGAGTQTIGGYNILTVEGYLFAVMTFGIVLTLRTIMELWNMKGAYNVEGVMKVMVSGLEEELKERMDGCRKLPGPDDGKEWYDVE